MTCIDEGRIRSSVGESVATETGMFTSSSSSCMAHLSCYVTTHLRTGNAGNTKENDSRVNQFHGSAYHKQSITISHLRQAYFMGKQIMFACEQGYFHITRHSLLTRLAQKCGLAQ